MTTHSGGGRGQQQSNPNNSQPYLKATHYCLQYVPSAEKEWKPLPERWTELARQHTQTNSRKRGHLQRGVAHSLFDQITTAEKLPAQSGDRIICCLSWSHPAWGGGYRREHAGSRRGNTQDLVDAILRVRDGSPEIVRACLYNAWKLHYNDPETISRPLYDKYDEYLTSTNWLSKRQQFSTCFTLGVFACSNI
eukprot:COSAG05_NODE_8445_length_703_cov_0.847682_1_plen_193_part_00